jgi:REP element-mobilizing transposase RayT
MSFDPDKHHRRSIRLPHFDYRTDGAYFITICVQGRRTVFGDVLNAHLVPSTLGEMVSNVVMNLPKFYPVVEIDEFVVMPNHIHAIMWLDNSAIGDDRGGQARRPAPTGRMSMSDVVQRFKSFTTNQAAKMGAGPVLWQRNFYEHVIRDDAGLTMVREYIRSNPQRWDEDRENPAGTGEDDVEQFVATLRPQADNSGDAGVAATRNANVD